MEQDGGAGDNPINTGEQAPKTGVGSDPGILERRKRVTRGIPPAHPAVVKERAREMYMNYQQRKVIADILRIPDATIRTWIKQGNWYRIRELENQEVATEILKRKAYLTANIAALSFEALSKAITTVAQQKTVSLEQGYKVAAILAQLDKVARLTQGEPTDIVEHKGTVGLKAIAFKTEKEIRAAIASDPMTKIDIPTNAHRIGPTPGVNKVGELMDQFHAEMAEEIKTEPKKDTRGGGPKKRGPE